MTAKVPFTGSMIVLVTTMAGMLRVQAGPSKLTLTFSARKQVRLTNQARTGDLP